MRVLILLLISATGYGQILPGSIGSASKKQTAAILDSAQFFFSNTSKTISGFTNVSGHPHTSVRTATGAYGIGVSSIATARWNPTASSTSADNAGEVGSSTHFPSGVTTNYWFQQTNAPDCAAGYTPNLEVNGLVVGATYTIYIISSRLASAVTLSTREMSAVCTDASTDEMVSIYNVKGNTSTIITFTGKVADSNGKLFFLIQARCAQSADHLFGYISGLKIKRTS